MMLMVIPTYIVTFTQPVGGHEHEVAWRVPETQLDDMLKVLRFNGIRKFSVMEDS